MKNSEKNKDKAQTKNSNQNLYKGELNPEINNINIHHRAIKDTLQDSREPIYIVQHKYHDVQQCLYSNKNQTSRNYTAKNHPEIKQESQLKKNLINSLTQSLSQVISAQKDIGNHKALTKDCKESQYKNKSFVNSLSENESSCNETYNTKKQDQRNSSTEVKNIQNNKPDKKTTTRSTTSQKENEISVLEKHLKPANFKGYFGSSVYHKDKMYFTSNFKLYSNQNGTSKLIIDGYKITSFFIYDEHLILFITNKDLMAVYKPLPHDFYRSRDINPYSVKFEVKRITYSGKVLNFAGFNDNNEVFLNCVSDIGTSSSQLYKVNLKEMFECRTASQIEVDLKHDHESAVTECTKNNIKNLLASNIPNDYQKTYTHGLEDDVFDRISQLNTSKKQIELKRINIEHGTFLHGQKEKYIVKINGYAYRNWKNYKGGMAGMMMLKSAFEIENDFYDESSIIEFNKEQISALGLNKKPNDAFKSDITKDYISGNISEAYIYNKRIYFCADFNGDRHVFSVDFGGKDLVKHTDGEGSYYDLKMSCDGNFTVNKDGQIYLMKSISSKHPHSVKDNTQNFKHYKIDDIQSVFLNQRYVERNINSSLFDVSDSGRVVSIFRGKASFISSHQSEIEIKSDNLYKNAVFLSDKKLLLIAFDHEKDFFEICEIGDNNTYKVYPLDIDFTKCIKNEHQKVDFKEFDVQPISYSDLGYIKQIHGGGNYFAFSNNKNQLYIVEFTNDSIKDNVKSNIKKPTSLDESQAVDVDKNPNIQKSDFKEIPIKNDSSHTHLSKNQTHLKNAYSSSEECLEFTPEVQAAVIKLVAEDDYDQIHDFNLSGSGGLFYTLRSAYNNNRKMYRYDIKTSIKTCIENSHEKVGEYNINPIGINGDKNILCISECEFKSDYDELGFGLTFDRKMSVIKISNSIDYNCLDVNNKFYELDSRGSESLPQENEKTTDKSQHSKGLFKSSEEKNFSSEKGFFENTPMEKCENKARSQNNSTQSSQGDLSHIHNLQNKTHTCLNSVDKAEQKLDSTCKGCIQDIKHLEWVYSRSHFIEIPGLEHNEYVDFKYSGDSLYIVSVCGFGKYKISKFSFKTHEIDVTHEGVSGYKFSNNGAYMVLLKDSVVRVIESDSPVKANDTSYKKGGLIEFNKKILCNQRQEWMFIFDSLVRMHKNLFWRDKICNMLDDLSEKYRPIVNNIENRHDLDNILAEFNGELQSSHVYIYESGDNIENNAFKNQSDAMGYLGGDFEYCYKQNALKVTNIKSSKSPLYKAGITEGSYILSINGESVLTAGDISRALYLSSGKKVLLEVMFESALNDCNDSFLMNSVLSSENTNTVELKSKKEFKNPSGVLSEAAPNNHENIPLSHHENSPEVVCEDACDSGFKHGFKVKRISVQPAISEHKINYDNYIKCNAELVDIIASCIAGHKVSVGYVHIPDMGQEGFNEFYPKFLSERSKSGLIIDVRYNNGGHTSSMIFEKLQSCIGYDKKKYGKAIPYPFEAVTSKMACLSNEYSCSDGDVFSYAFKALKKGDTIGKRTWGGVVGISFGSENTGIDSSKKSSPGYPIFFGDDFESLYINENFDKKHDFIENVGFDNHDYNVSNVRVHEKLMSYLLLDEYFSISECDIVDVDAKKSEVKGKMIDKFGYKLATFIINNKIKCIQLAKAVECLVGGLN